MIEKIEPQKLILTDKLLEQIRFEQRIVGLQPDGSLQTIPVPEGMTDWFLRDAKLPGFSVRVTGKSLRFYAERKLAGRPCRFACGAWPETSIGKARKNAEHALAMMKLGQDPNLQKKKYIAEVKHERKLAKKTLGAMFANDISVQAEVTRRQHTGIAKMSRNGSRGWLFGAPRFMNLPPKRSTR